jgi:hypothetical protein
MTEHLVRHRAYWDDLAREYVEADQLALAKKEPRGGCYEVDRALPRKHWNIRKVSGFTSVEVELLSARAWVTGLDQNST